MKSIKIFIFRGTIPRASCSLVRCFCGIRMDIKTAGSIARGGWLSFCAATAVRLWCMVAAAFALGTDRASWRDSTCQR